MGSESIERLLPVLLDRLTDDEPQKAQESKYQRANNLNDYRDSLVRDMGWLFGCSGLAPLDGPFEWIVELATGTTKSERDRWIAFHRDEVENPYKIAMYHQARSSVVNFGLRHIAALHTDESEIERQLHAAILVFEPRILPNTLKVSVKRAGYQVKIKLEFEYWAIPISQELFLDTVIDLQEERATVRVAAKDKEK